MKFIALLTFAAGVVIISIISIPPAFGECGKSVVDTFPLISQFKSLFQVIGGDSEGAKCTQERFSKTYLPVAAVRSIIEAAQGNSGDAAEIWNDYGNIAYQKTKSIPVVGHGIGVGHYIAGNTNEGDQIMKDATKSVAVIGGAFAGGPAGAIGAGVAYDGLVTGIDSAVNGQYKPYGTIGAGTNIVNQETSPGEIFDTAFGLTMDGVAGAMVKYGQSRNSNSRTRFGADDGSRRPPASGQLPQAGNLPRFTATANDLLRAVEPWEMSHINTAGPSVYNPNVRIPTMYNCAYCTLGALKKITVTELVNLLNKMDIEGPHMAVGFGKKAAVGIKQIGQLFKEAGYKDVMIKSFEAMKNVKESFSSKLADHSLGQYLQKSLEPWQETRFGLAYETGTGGHVVVLKAWRNAQGSVETRMIDFQQPPNSPSRFLTNHLPSGKTFLIDLNENSGNWATPMQGGGATSSSSTNTRFGSLNHYSELNFGGSGISGNRGGWINVAAGSGAVIAKAGDTSTTTSNSTGFNLKLDLSSAPLTLFSVIKQARSMIMEVYPYLTKYLASDGYTVTKTLELKFEDCNGGSNSGGSVRSHRVGDKGYIWACNEYFMTNPTPTILGQLMTALVYIVEDHNTEPRPPFYVFQGIAFYMRRYLYENQPLVKPRFDQGFRTNADNAAYLFNYIESKTPVSSGMNIIQILNQVAREGKFKEGSFWNDYTGMSIAQWWQKATA